MCSHQNGLIKTILISIHNILFYIKNEKITLNYPKSAFFEGTQKRARNNRGKRAISVRATEVCTLHCTLIRLGRRLDLVIFFSFSR